MLNKKQGTTCLLNQHFLRVENGFKTQEIKKNEINQKNVFYRINCFG